MKHIFFICLTVLGLLTGCSPKPTDAEVSAVLLQNLPESLKTASTLESVQTELNVAGDETLVKFKSVTKLSQPLFEKVEFNAAAQAAGFETLSYKAIDKGMSALSASAREALAELAKQATDKPTMLKEVAASGANSDWYGSFRFKKVVDS